MASSHGGPVKVLDQLHISPPPGPSLPLTFFDIVWLFQSPVERFFLFDYPYSTTHFIESHLPKLSSSLSLTLASFYPLAGKVRRCSDSEYKFELRYEEGDSVQFTVAEATHIGFSDIAGSQTYDYVKVRPLVPDLPESDIDRSLFAVQVTVFPNQGISVAFAVHHLVCDGTSSLHFLKSWAAACRSDGSVPPAEPVYDRALVADPWGLYPVLARDFLSLKSRPKKSVMSSGLESYEGVVCATFTLGSGQIQRLKKWVQAKAELASATFHCSTVVVSTALMWTCHVKARRMAADRPAYLVLPVDWRGRLGIPAAYFGNVMGPCIVEAKVGDLASDDSIFVAARAIGEAIEGLKDGVFKTMEGYVERFLAMAADAPLSGAGSPRFGVYGIDFRWGRPRKVGMTSIQKTGAMLLADSREEEGGMEIGLIRKEEEMEEFMAHFHNGLQRVFS